VSCSRAAWSPFAQGPQKLSSFRDLSLGHVIWGVPENYIPPRKIDVSFKFSSRSRLRSDRREGTMDIKTKIATLAIPGGSNLRRR